MRKIVLLIIIGIFGIVCVNYLYALNLARVKTWTSGEVLTASDLNAEFDNILDHSITNADVSSTAAIAGSKLDLSVPGAIGATTASNGTFTTLTANTALNPDASDGCAIGTTALEWSDIYLADGAKIDLGDDQDVTITHVADAGILLELDDYISFGDSAVYIESDDDAHLDLVADTSIDFIIGSTEQFELVDGGILPTTNNDIDLGSDTVEYKDIWVDGTAYLDSAQIASLTTLTTLTASGDLDIGAYELRAQTLEADVATGTAPLTITSTTKVTNLCADLLDTYNTGTTAAASTIYVSDATNYLPDDTIDTSALKTATAEVSSNVDSADDIDASAVGTYGFWPQMKQAEGVIARCYPGTTSTSYVTKLTVTRGGAGSQAAFAQFRYVTASGVDHWIFLLIDKSTEEIIIGWRALDHPLEDHPFGKNYNPIEHKIILVDKETSLVLEQESRQINKSILTLINDEYKIGEESAYIPLYSGKIIDGESEIIKTIPNYIEVRELIKLTDNEKKQKEIKRELKWKEKEQEQKQKKQFKKSAEIKLKSLGLTKDEIDALLERD